MRRGDWKLHHFYSDNRYELYNLKYDIGESENLSGKEPTVLAEMKQELIKEYDRIGTARMLPKNPDYDGAAGEAWLETNPPYPTTAENQHSGCL